MSKKPFVYSKRDRLEIDSSALLHDDPPPFDPLEPSNPVSYPLKTLEELESRSYFDSFHFPFNKASVKLPPDAANELPKRPRLLVCHDMAGGYLDDSGYKEEEIILMLMLWHWKLLANKLLSSKNSAQMYAERLSELAFALGFDGWLVNMEVSLDVGQIPNTKEFVSHLTQSMHSLVPGSLVIWYDSITIDGKLSWQNQLNEKNKPFFDISDGMLLTTLGKENYPKHSAEVAGDRKFDVYMGIDVFGRNTYGGGQWRSGVMKALRSPLTFGGRGGRGRLLSPSSIMAKSKRRSNGDEAKALRDQFFFRVQFFSPSSSRHLASPDSVFLSSLFYTEQNLCLATNVALDVIKRDNVSTAHICSWMKDHGVFLITPNSSFYSNFDQGHGYQFSVDGKQISQAPWNNISSQSFQPFLELSGESTGGHLKVICW
ncbi:hypothetical protein HAX54_026133 [Datura stramonium]|uniref:Cytosolic endo-beta-N-acetylglucosaminidase TIM barrel domain-containing protein n=1 Tax=Datura stramonium TaxID=4076 RepID=A0ABS8V0W7_DATST|nr:hypothetical protein [Datura stramonium]